jgi:hypothetical protein
MLALELVDGLGVERTRQLPLLVVGQICLAVTADGRHLHAIHLLSDLVTAQRQIRIRDRPQTDPTLLLSLVRIAQVRILVHRGVHRLIVHLLAWIHQLAIPFKQTILTVLVIWLSLITSLHAITLHLLELLCCHIELVLLLLLLLLLLMHELVRKDLSTCLTKNGLLLLLMLLLLLLVLLLILILSQRRTLMLLLSLVGRMEVERLL